MHTTTRLNVSFAVAVATAANNDIVEAHTVFNDDVQEEREIKSRVCYRTNFPFELFNKQYTKSFNKLSWKQKQNCTNIITKELIASC